MSRVNYPTSPQGITLGVNDPITQNVNHPVIPCVVRGTSLNVSGAVTNAGCLCCRPPLDKGLPSASQYAAAMSGQSGSQYATLNNSLNGYGALGNIGSSALGALGTGEPT